jgi:FkbH-like protein
VSALHQSLAWLKPAPRDFRARLKAACELSDPGNALRALCGHALGSDQLEAVSRVLRQMPEAVASLQPFKLGLLGNGTLDYVRAAIEGTGPRFGFTIRCVRGDYDQVLQDALSPTSAVNAAEVDAVVLALDYRGLPLQCEVGSEQAAEDAADRAFAYIEQACGGLRRHSGAVPIVQILAPPPEALFGALDRIVPGSPFDLVQRLNRRLAATFTGAEGLLLDVARLAETVGTANWFDPALWNLAKAPFAHDWLSLYAEHLCRLLAAIKGKSRKCLILDLDNTLWGGVIGDDGLDGIVLAQGDAVGEAFLSLQSYALTLRERGIVLAVSSKNEDAVARRVFREHPEMLIREDHVAVFQANWQDKATNIASIAAELSLGLDAMVFVDDNPVERERVRQALPVVAVPELPDDPALYARTLAAAGYFEAIAFSEEDRKRAGFYQENARRAALLAQADGLDAYLQSLDMQIDFRPFDGVNRARIAQLINKSNQFNLTTRRYTEAEVAALEAAGCLHPPGPPDRRVRRQRHDQRGDLPSGQCGALGGGHLADELPGARPQGRGHGAQGDRARGARPGCRRDRRRLPADRTQRDGPGPLREGGVRGHVGGRRRDALALLHGRRARAGRHACEPALPEPGSGRVTVPSFPFLLFAALAAAAYNLPGIAKARPLVLLAANLGLLFSFSSSVTDLVPFAMFLALGYGAIALLARRGGRGIAALMIGLVLLTFVWLKKYSFVPSDLWLHAPYVTVGLSYVFFRVMHLVVDAGQGDMEGPVPILSYVNYCTNFLCLTAGPIQRYEDYAEQQAAPYRRPSADVLIEVVERVLLGLFKVMVVSMLLLEQHKHVVAMLNEPSADRASTALQVVLIYPLYLYANFSGYCDVVIALGRLFRLDLPENFNRPFSATNFIEFWSRWHITLSTWLKTYVFTPLMMRLMRQSDSPAAASGFSAFAFFVTFFLVGAWHGQTSEFLFFGLLQGGGVACNKLYQTAMTKALGRKRYLALSGNAFYAAICRGLAFVWFGFTLLWFWSDWSTIGRLWAFLGPGGAAAAAILAVALSSVVLVALCAARRAAEAWRTDRKYARVAWASAQATTLWLVVSILAAPPPDIVYQAF